MLAPKRKGAHVDPNYRPGFVPQAKLRAMMDRLKPSPAVTPGSRQTRSSPKRALKPGKQTTPRGTAKQLAVFVCVASWGIWLCCWTMVAANMTAVHFGRDCFALG